MKGLASDGGLFIPEQIPSLPESWESDWRDLSFEDLAFEIAKLYISSTEIPAEDLKEIIKRSYSTFRHAERTPLVPLDTKENLYLLELFHGPTFAFKVRYSSVYLDLVLDESLIQGRTLLYNC